MRESTVEKHWCDYAKKRGWIAVKLAGPNHRGIPDRVFLRNGRAVFVEFKAPGRKPTELQQKWIRDLHNAGFHAMTVDNTKHEFLSLMLT